MSIKFKRHRALALTMYAVAAGLAMLAVLAIRERTDTQAASFGDDQVFFPIPAPYASRMR